MSPAGEASSPQASSQGSRPKGGPDWDAATYDRVSDPQLGWALEQLDRMDLQGDEVVLDAGCGSGRVTALLADRVPRGGVYAVDAAPSMAEHARSALRERATVLCQDLVELDLPEPVDAVFSNATFHWIPDHERLFAVLHGALRPGGRLVAQCGGIGNIDAFRTTADSVAAEEPFDHYFVGWRKPWNYAGPEETVARLEHAGFREVKCWLEPKRVELADPRPFIQTVCLVRHLDPLPEGLRGPFLDRVLARTGTPLILHYVRLNMTATRGVGPDAQTADIDTRLKLE
jgi:trans-aconitate 2-methyltransferase